MIHPADEMSKTLNGNGNGTSGLLRPAPKQAALPAAAPASGIRESRVTFHTADGVGLRGALSRVTRHAVVFELYSPGLTPRFSEVFDDLKIILQERTVYAGRAVVRNVVDAGTKVMCEATLTEAHWTDVDLDLLVKREGQVAQEFKTFIHEWQKLYKVTPEFKIAIADMQTCLHDLRLWLEQVELGINQAPASERDELEEQMAKQVGQLFVPAFDKLHEKLEAVSGQIYEDQRPMHQAFAQRQLNSLVLCSPFANRAYTKPLGYAGDYEMVNMIGLNPYRGASLYAKVVNFWFLSQWPSQAHRNRLVYLKETLERETRRVVRSHRPARIYNFACGPALEVQEFLSDSLVADRVELTLADFNEETLKHTGKAIDYIKERRALKAQVHFQKKTVNHIIKAGKGSKTQTPEYDVVYCAGLFDYLSDSICRQLMEVFYGWLAPGGLLLVTNVDDYKPFRHMLEFVLDWHLIYRNAEQGASLIPDCVPRDERRVVKDSTGVNIFIEARKPGYV
jgi:extracellular factor (EF) 3-hydroxypalmitic acid methyl ester biosynthesis protein